MIRLIEAYLDENKRQEGSIRGSLQSMMMHMLKCMIQFEYENKASWRGSIWSGFSGMVNEFDEVGKGALYKTYYLKKLNLQEIYERSLVGASIETKKDRSLFPKKCPWTKEQLTNLTFIEEFINEHGQGAE